MLRYTSILQIITLYVLNASIAGVTYMDHFDFEQRYRDVNECNPLYWHPLHLPEKCVEMFEELIRSRLRALTPYKIVKERQVQDASIYSSSYINSPIYETKFVEPLRDLQTLSPMEVLFELLRRDVLDMPSAPTLAVSPYFGVMALYRQPVSSKSEAMIKKISKAYADSGYFGIDDSHTNNNNNIDIGKQKKKVSVNKKIKNGTTITESVIKNNDILTLLKIFNFK